MWNPNCLLELHVVDAILYHWNGHGRRWNRSYTHFSKYFRYWDSLSNFGSAYSHHYGCMDHLWIHSSWCCREWLFDYPNKRWMEHCHDSRPCLRVMLCLYCSMHALHCPNSDQVELGNDVIKSCPLKGSSEFKYWFFCAIQTKFRKMLFLFKIFPKYNKLRQYNILIE